MNENFEDRYQNLVLLAEEPAVTALFNAQLQELLNENEQALDMAMEPEAIEAIRLRLPLLRELLENQEKFLLDLRAQVLIECWPAAPEPLREVTN